MARYSVPGPCLLTWNSIELGYTKAGVSIQVRTGLVPIVDDEHGTEPADWIRAGKSAIVSAIMMDPAKFKAAMTSVAASYPDLFSIKNRTTPVNQLGKLANSGDGVASQFGKELKITEREVTNLWIADYTLMSDPQQLLMASTQEVQIPIQFVVALNDADELFSTVPAYMRA